jgi:hypothetical protein
MDKCGAGREFAGQGKRKLVRGRHGEGEDGREVMDAGEVMVHSTVSTA